jgi:hypothetical protein
VVKIQKAIFGWKVVYTGAARNHSVLDNACLQDHFTAELQLPFYRLTEAIRIKEASLKMCWMRPIVPPRELNATDSRSTVYSGEVFEFV